MSIKIILASTALLLVFPLAVFGSEVNILPPGINVSKSSQFNVSVNVSDVSNLFGAAFDLIYDPIILEFISAKEDGFLRGSGIPTLFNAKLLSDAGGNPYPGNLVVGYSRLASGGMAAGKDGSGTLVILTFKALNPGTSELIFKNNHLLNPEIKEITTNWRDGAVKVEIPLLSTSTPTPILTPTFTPSHLVSSKKIPSSLLTLITVNESMAGMVLNEISQSAILFISLFILTVILLLIIFKEIKNIIKKR